MKTITTTTNKINLAGIAPPQLQNLASSSVPQTRKFLLRYCNILLVHSSLQLLATVAQNSVVVRMTIAGHGQFRAIPTLLSLVPLSVPFELKGTIFDTVAAFCEPGAGVSGVEICKAIWTMRATSRKLLKRQRRTHPLSFSLMRLTLLHLDVKR